MKSLKSLLLLCMLMIGMGAWAEESVYKTALFGSSYNSQNVQNYTTSWSATNNGFTVNIANFNNNNSAWSYVKGGNKTSASVCTIATAAAIDKAVTKVVVTVDAATTASINSTTLTVASDASFTQNVQTVNVTAATGNMTYTIENPTENSYYKLSYDCKKGTSNGLIQISKVDYYVDDSQSGDDPQPSISASSTLNLGAEEGNGTIDVTWTLMEDMDVNLYSDADCTVEFAEDWFTAALDKDNNVEYFVEENTSASPRTVYIQLYGLDAEANEYTQVIAVTQAGAVVKYNVTIADGIENGTVTADPTTAAEGEVVTLTATPADGYRLAAWDVKDAESNAVAVTDNKFTMPAMAVTVSATFEVKPVDNRTTVTASGFTSVNGDMDTAISYESFQGKASTAPGVYNDNIRLYQNGGYITITAASPATLSEVSITTASTYTSTTVGVAVGNAAAPTTGATVAKDTKYTVSDLDCSSISFYCLGTDKNTRLEIAEIEVKYNGTAAARVSKIELSGDYPTEFYVGDEFSHEGMVVTATYTDDTTKDVTAEAEFSGFDSSAIKENQTITVSYTENAKTVETTYKVNIVKAPIEKHSMVQETTDFAALYASVGSSLIVEDVEGTTYDIIFAKPQSSSTPTKYYDNGKAVRIYTDNTITISAIDPIVKVEVDYVEGYADNDVSVSEGTATYDKNSVLNWWVNDGETTEVTLTAGSTSRFKTITVYYQKATLNLSSTDGNDYYATFSNEKAFVVPEDLTVSVVAVNNGNLTIEDYAAGDVVAANTGVLVKGTEGSHTVVLTTAEATEDPEYNMLVASSVAQTGDDYLYYMLSYDKNHENLGFYWGAENGGEFNSMLVAGKAYLQVPKRAGAKPMMLLGGGTATGIENASASSAHTQVYNLQGQRVNAGQKGIVIVNGRKVVVK